jgi:hypothetical protein
VLPTREGGSPELRVVAANSRSTKGSTATITPAGSSKCFRSIDSEHIGWRCVFSSQTTTLHDVRSDLIPVLEEVLPSPVPSTFLSSLTRPFFLLPYSYSGSPASFDCFNTEISIVLILVASVDLSLVWRSNVLCLGTDSRSYRLTPHSSYVCPEPCLMNRSLATTAVFQA